MTADDLRRLAAMRACARRHSWREIGDHLGVTWQTVRGQWRRYAKKLNVDGEPCPICGCGDGGDRSEWKEHGNYAEANAVGERVQTLDQLLEVARVDLDTWEIRDWGVKKWEVGAKVEVGHLDFDEGRITGHLDKKGIGVQDLWSVWAKFIRREPIAILPAIQPVRCDYQHRPSPEPDACGVRRALLLPDAQFGYSREIRTGELRPFADRRALDLAVQLAEVLQVDRIVILGDLLDLTMFTDRFAVRPEFYWTTQPAILEAHYWLRSLRAAAPHAGIDILEGNHDARIRGAIAAHLQEAYQLRAADEMHLPSALSPERLLALHHLGIGWVAEYPDAELWLGPLRCEHGARISQAPGGSARMVAEGSDQHTVFGHVHRIEQVSRRVRSREGWRTVRSFTPGCLCWTDGRVPGSKVADNWQQGIGIAEYTEEDYSVTLIEINDGCMIYASRVWEGRDFTAELRKLWPDFHW